MSKLNGGGCNPLACCCRCICSCITTCIMQIICIILVITAIIILVLWLVFRANKVDFYVTDVSLMQFDFFPPTNTLNYDLAVNIAINNTNKRLAIYYDSIEAGAFYENQRFGSLQLNPFFQGFENTSSIHPVFHGHNVVVLGKQEVYEYFRDKNSGVFEIDVKLYLTARFELFGFIKSPRLKPTIDCKLKAPLNSAGNSSATFLPTGCGFDW